MIITRNEVKNILGLTDSLTNAESVTFDSVVYETLANFPNVDILLVCADTKNSTVSSTQYDTTDYYSTQDAEEKEFIRRIDTGTITDTQTVYVSYTYNDYDSTIDLLIPLVQEDLCDYLNNYFPDKNTRYSASSITLNNLTPPTITDTESQFVIEGFESDMDITVEGTHRNKGIYHIDTAAAGTLTLSGDDELLDESSTDEYGGNTIRITRIKWPAGIKQLVSQIIWFNIDKATSGDIKSKRLGPSSITYHSLESGGYPSHIMRGLNKYRYINMPKGDQ